MFMADTLTLDAPRRTADGYLAVRARAARTGVQDYLGCEVDPKGTKFGATDKVAVYRPEVEVFDRASLHSFLMKPITNDHPTEPVTAANWKDHAGGVVARAVRDGDHVAFDLVLMDAKLIADVDAGKRGLSNGYACDLAFEDGIAPDGTPYQAVQRGIAGNHVAVVKAGRAGELARIGDATALCDALPTDILDANGDSSMNTKTITFDGLPLLVTDAAEAAINKLQAVIADTGTKLAAADTKVVELTTVGATKDADIVTLKQAVIDAKVTPAQMRDAARAYALVVDKAKVLVPTLAIADAMDETAIKRGVVNARLGDVAKDWNDAQIDTSFATMAATVTVPARDTMRDAITNAPVSFADAATREAAALAHASDVNAWRKAA